MVISTNIKRFNQLILEREKAISCGCSFQKEKVDRQIKELEKQLSVDEMEQLLLQSSHFLQKIYWAGKIGEKNGNRI